MDLRRKNIFYTVVLLLAMLVVYWVRESNDELTSDTMTAFSGTTMGTIQYNVKYFDNRVYKESVDSLLQVFNASLNTYIPDSEISRFNTDSSFRFVLPYFPQVLASSKYIYEETGGAFDPTVMPLVNAWGFGPNNDLNPDSVTIDSLRKFVGFNLINFNDTQVWKSDHRVSLDFSASAKGQGVDVVVEFLRSKGIEDIFVEIGGEVRVVGMNVAKNRPWSVVILDPRSTEDQLKYMATLELSDGGLATSGNYFNYRVMDGRKYSHTLDPASGYPVVHPLLSASVMAPTCMEADALATAFMVMGHEKAIAYLTTHEDIGAYLVFSGPDGQISTYATSSLKITPLNE